MDIVKIYHLNREKNRLICYIKTNEHDFDMVSRSGKFVKTPNEYFYRKARKMSGLIWQPTFGWRLLSNNEVADLVKSYRRKRDFCEKQANVLETLTTL